VIIIKKPQLAKTYNAMLHVYPVDQWDAWGLGALAVVVVVGDGGRGLIKAGAQEGEGKGDRELGLRKDPRERLERYGKGGDVKWL